MSQRVIKTISRTLEAGYVIVTSCEEESVPNEGEFKIRGDLIYQSDDNSLAHDLFSVGRLKFFESLGNEIKTIYIVMSQALIDFLNDPNGDY